MDNTKIEPTTRKLRCEKCYRLHDLVWLSINNTLVLGYQCFSHKKAALGFFYMKKFAVTKHLTSEIINIYGVIRLVKNSWYEVTLVSKTKTTAIQDKFNFA